MGSGGTLRTAIGVLAIEAVDPVEMEAITEEQAERAGFGSRGDLLEELSKRSRGQVYRIKVSYLGADPREALRDSANLSDQEIEEIRARLERFDRASPKGPWTAAVLGSIGENPGTRAPDLAVQLGFEAPWFKTKVRRLKDLGLTESLAVGYRLSPRGRAFLRDDSASS